ncbi:interferon-induced protein 44-like [Saccostrea cucullata]|uniref:interferon-induced protein 44-like n=1 Tax=Saccostrea cuccullata TaxID=36930 RepID=UPI002ED2F98D
MRSYVRNIKKRPDVPFFNCLLIGQIANGKTSFINSAVTAIADEGRRKSPFTVYSRGKESTTKTLCLCPLLVNEDEDVRLRFYDCRGLHDIESLWFDDIMNIINGHILPGYEFDSNTPITKEHEMYRKDPKLADKMHCVVYVINATAPKEALATKTAEETFEKIRQELTKSNIPQLILMTKVDNFHKNFQEDLEKIFYSNYVKMMRDFIAQYTSLTKDRVLLQANYCGETSISPQKDFLTLYNLQKIVESIEDYIKYVLMKD